MAHRLPLRSRLFGAPRNRGMRNDARGDSPGGSGSDDVPQQIAAAAEPLPDPSDPAFAARFDRYADARVVLLGEASHGTSEFYRARDAITRRLIEQHGFTIVAVEADWPDAAAINRHVRHAPPRVDAEPVFQRFPTWMWRNAETVALVEWMRGFNAGREAVRQAGFYGLDMYNLGGSIAAVLAHLDHADPEAAAIARERYGCLMPWRESPATYGRAVLTAGYRSCEAEVVAQCRALLERHAEASTSNDEAWLDAAQNARLVAAAERYYRVMYYGGAEGWNLRDRHMFGTLRHLLDAKGVRAKAVVWAHNSHIGDARQTEMGRARGELNLGQLCREHYDGDAVLIGFGTHGGRVAAASDWDGDLEIIPIRPSHADSIERWCHDAALPRFLLDFRQAPTPLQFALRRERLERFIGVIYRPDTELQSHYAAVSLARQFDAWVWFDETTPVTPLGPQHARPGVPETWPFGL